MKEKQLRAFTNQVQKPAVFVGTPEYYHRKKAFGYWSLPTQDTEVEKWIEKQLSTIVNFYQNEVENRNWYGLFDYGDFMHTYDPIRHCWKYDTGGFAWQNTELVPTYWLWLQFMRTGDEKIFTLAEKMSRHCSEVDFYHFGEMKGIGSRHNVRHWGCACKEPRISMAGHHRFYYYLTGDQRIGDTMEDAKDADQSMVNLKHYHSKNPDGSVSPEWKLRSGPDWTSLLSDWMTQYERTLDRYYLNKIKQGISDLEKTPFGLASGPEYEYDTQTGALTYLGENEETGMHLQVCMGGSEVWMELADQLEEETLKKMLIWYGRFYMLSPQQKKEETNGQIFRRSFAFPYFAAALAAYSAAGGIMQEQENKKLSEENRQLADHVWKQLLGSLAKPKDNTGFASIPYAVCNKAGSEAQGKVLFEIPWIKTNYAAQWSLNMIVALEFLRKFLPKTRKQMDEFLENADVDTYHKA